MLVLRHQAAAPAGLIGSVLARLGLSWQVLRVDRGQVFPEPASVSLAVVLGSDFSAGDPEPDWIAAEQEWLRCADRTGTSVLGVGFGAQALAVALGGRVVKGAATERGFVYVTSRRPDVIASGPWLTWHDDLIVLPAAASLLAHNERGPQGYTARRHLGVQFHPEATEEIVASWINASSEDNTQVMLDGKGANYRHAAAHAERLVRYVVARAGGRGRSDWATGEGHRAAT